MNFLRAYVRFIDAANYRIGRMAMYGIFALIAVLLWSTFTKVTLVPSLWTLEVAQFVMVAYYVLGGPYSIQLGSNVRMDLFYGEWTVRRKAQVDAVTAFFLLFYLGVLLYGAIDSTRYAIEYGERSPSVWQPYLWPVKIVMCLGIFLMLLQVVSEFIKDIFKLRGETF